MSPPHCGEAGSDPHIARQNLAALFFGPESSDVTLVATAPRPRQQSGPGAAGYHSRRGSRRRVPLLARSRWSH
jgi:hypothetical protein